MSFALLRAIEEEMVLCLSLHSIVQNIVFCNACKCICFFLLFSLRIPRLLRSFLYLCIHLARQTKIAAVNERMKMKNFTESN